MAILIPKANAPVLQAEDDEPDVYFMRRAFAQVGVAQPLIALPDGQEVLCYLQGDGVYSDRSRYPEPCLLVLVLSSSGLENDKRKAFELGTHEYLVKPGDFSGLVSLVEDLNRRWLDPIAAGQTVMARPPPGQ